MKEFWMKQKIALFLKTLISSLLLQISLLNLKFQPTVKLILCLRI